MEGQDLAFTPGQAWAYSNTNYILLGVVAARAGGAPFAALLRREVIAPLGLRDTVLVPDESTPKRLVTGYDRDLIPLPGKRVVGPDHLSWASLAWAFGGLVSTAGDLARFTRALATGRLLRPATVDRMAAFHDLPEGSLEGATGCGLGLFRIRVGGRDCWGHHGGFIGFSSIALHDPATGHTIAAVGNVSKLDMEAVAAALRAAMDRG